MATPQIDTATAMELFDAIVQTKYQNEMKLMNTIDERHGTQGTTLNVPVSGEIELELGNFSPTDIPVTDVNETNITVTTNDYHVKTVIGGGQKTLFNYDKIVVQARLHGLAGGRMDDYVKLNAIYSNAGVSSIHQIAVTTGVNTGINSGKLSAGMSYLMDQGVDVDNYSVSMWAPAKAMPSMLDDERVVNIFYNDVKPLTNFKIKTYDGVDCRFLGSNGINTIPYTANGGGSGIDQYLVPLVHKDAIVQSYNRDVTTSITWVQQQDRYELLTIFTSGASVIQLNGIVFLVVNVPFAENP